MTLVYLVPPGAVIGGLVSGALSLELSLEAGGGGSDANVFFENGIVALPVGIGVRSFHKPRETADIPEIMEVARMCEGDHSGSVTHWFRGDTEPTVRGGSPRRVGAPTTFRQRKFAPATPCRLTGQSAAHIIADGRRPQITS